jgi:dTDP-4-dehydrorhamnose reductase
MRLLVTGGAGMLGQAVAAAATRLGHDVVALARADLDVTDTDHVRRVVAAAEPRAVVNCAAWTDVDGAETAEAAATAVNGQGAGNVARAAAEIGARIVHVSTDYVFDGERAHAGGGSGEPWLESDAVNPIGAYGRSKLAGEEQVAAATGEHAIVRTAWLFGAGGRNFVDTMLALGHERDEVSVLRDWWSSPSAAATSGSCTRPAAAPARGTSWPSRSSIARACAAASCRPRPIASRAPRGAPRTRCSAPNATRHRCCHRGRPAWPGT